MRLRIIAGGLGGRYLRIDGAAERFRPTQEQVRGAAANILRERIEGAAVGDFCAGSGAFGFEMASRGAAMVHFVESDMERAHLIERAVRGFSLTEQCRVFCTDIAAFVKRREFAYEIIYFDPPYDADGMPALVPGVAAMLSPGGVLIYERGGPKRGERSAAVETGVQPLDVRRYGDTVLEFYHAESPGHQVDEQTGPG